MWWHLIHSYCAQQLKHQRDKLKQYKKKILIVIEKDKEIARRLLKENKKE